MCKAYMYVHLIVIRVFDDNTVFDLPSSNIMPASNLENNANRCSQYSCVGHKVDSWVENKTKEFM